MAVLSVAVHTFLLWMWERYVHARTDLSGADECGK